MSALTPSRHWSLYRKVVAPSSRGRHEDLSPGLDTRHNPQPPAFPRLALLRQPLHLRHLPLDEESLPRRHRQGHYGPNPLRPAPNCCDLRGLFLLWAREYPLRRLARSIHDSTGHRPEQIPPDLSLPCDQRRQVSGRGLLTKEVQLRLARTRYLSCPLGRQPFSRTTSWPRAHVYSDDMTLTTAQTCDHCHEPCLALPFAHPALVDAMWKRWVPSRGSN